MKRLARSKGYTIVEVMIFLAITGVLLASALLIFRGRQERTQFSQGVREIDAQIRTIINEAASGYYPNRGNIRCTSTGGNGPQLSTTSPNQQGGNAGCLYLGRVIQFTDSFGYNVYTVVGQQKGQNGREVTSLGSGQNEARQTLVVPASGQADAPNGALSYVLPWGITVTRITTPSPAAPTTGAIGFISSFGTQASNGTDLISGSSMLNTIPLAGTSLGPNNGPSVQNTVTATKNLTSTSPQNPGRIVICLRSGGGNRQAAIVIGGSNNNTGTEVVLSSVPTECVGA